jgi:hypothetical protein
MHLSLISLTNIKFLFETTISRRLSMKFWKSQRKSTKHTYKTKDRVTRTPLKTGGERMCSGRVSSSCSASDTRPVNLVTHPLISHKWGKDREVVRQVEHTRGHLRHRYSIGYSIFSCMCMFCRSLIVLFLLVIVLSVLLYEFWLHPYIIC